MGTARPADRQFVQRVLVEPRPEALVHFAAYVDESMEQPGTYFRNNVVNTLNLLDASVETPDGTGIRDYIHVTDLVHAHVRGLEYLFAHHSSLEQIVATAWQWHPGQGIRESVPPHAR